MYNLRFAIRDLVYPGLDIHTRDRASLCRFWKSGSRDFLDAGSGNGYFSWLAYLSGARVVALNIETNQVERARNYLIGHRGADSQRLSFECGNLYNLRDETRRFDEIICYEVLEHLNRDAEVLGEFYRILRPGGVLHLCCPNSAHPRHQSEILDLHESGGHVRPGYTLADYRTLLEPLGFTIDATAGLGTKTVFYADAMMRRIRGYLGDIVALPFLPLILPFLWLAKPDPSTPFSLYVRAVKPSEN